METKKLELKTRASEYFRGLQNEICASLADINQKSHREDKWTREGGGGGITRIFEGGQLLEKGGVNFSEVYGEFTPEFAKTMPVGEGLSFYATGVSLVLHPVNPFVPTVHANFRYLQRGNAGWFGGGAYTTYNNHLFKSAQYTSQGGTNLMSLDTEWIGAHQYYSSFYDGKVVFAGFVSGGSTPTRPLAYFNSIHSAQPTIVARTATSQTADLQQWQNSTGTTLSVVNSNGYFGIGTNAPDRTLVVNGAAKIASTLDMSGARIVNLGMPVDGNDGVPRDYLTDTAANLASVYLKKAGDTMSGYLRAMSSVHLDGNVGVGTTTPVTRLHVAGDSNDVLPSIATGTVLVVSNSDTTNRNSNLSIISGNTGRSRIYLGDADSEVSGGALTYNNTDNSFAISTNTNERIRITSTGNVGIGTASPDRMLHVDGAARIASTLDMSGARIVSVGSPIDDTDVANKAYVDAVGSSISNSGNYVVKSGDTMTGALRIANSLTVSEGINLANNKMIHFRSLSEGGMYAYSLGYHSSTDSLRLSSYRQVYDGTSGSRAVSIGGYDFNGTDYRNTIFATPQYGDVGIGGNIVFTGNNTDGPDLTGARLVVRGNTGFVGIGAATPDRALVVNGAARIASTLDMSGARIVSVGNPTDTADAINKLYADSNIMGMSARTNGYDVGYVLKWDGTYWSPGSGSGDNLGNHTATAPVILTAGSAAAPSLTFSGDTDMGMYRAGTDYLGFSTAGTQRMTVLSTGQVNIDTINSLSKLAIGQGTNTHGLWIDDYGSSDIPGLVLYRGRGTVGAPLTLQTGDVLGDLRFGGKGTSVNPESSIIRSVATEDWDSASDYGSRIDFLTSSNGTSTPVVRMSVGQNGYVGIGTTTPDRMLHVNGAARIASTLDMSGARIVSVGNPTDTADAINKFYADSKLAGFDISTTGITVGHVLKWNGTYWYADTGGSGGGGGIGGSGTTNYIPKFSSSDTLANSSLEDKGSGVLNIDNATGRLEINDVYMLHTSGGANNTFAGLTSGDSIGGSADANTGLGFGSLTALTSGDSNTALGYRALNSVSTGGGNTAVGADALRFNTGSNNLAVGTSSLLQASGDQNTSIGSFTLINLGNGNRNTVIGYNAGQNVTSGSSGNVIIGHQAGPTGVGTYDNLLFIANTLTNTPLIFGDFAASSLVVNGQLSVAGNRVVNVAAPSHSADAANKDYIDTLNANLGSQYVRKSGDTVSGYLRAMSSVNIDGRVGIGTNAPGTALEVSVANTTGLSTAVFRNTASAANAWAGIQISDDVNTHYLWSPSSAYGYSHLRGRLILQASDSVATGVDIMAPNAAGNIRFITGAYDSANTRIIISSIGNIGIGTVSPDRTLVVNGAARIASTLDMSGARIVSVGNPTDSSDAANKAYVDAVASSISGGGDYVSKAGDTMTGLLYVNSSLHINGNVGIGTTTPEFKLSLDNDAGILAKGTNGSGLTLSTSGAGTRLIWYPRKSAFRAGYVSGTQWNDASIGPSSTAIGHDSVASGQYSTAIGGFNTASGLGSTALGYGSTASGISSQAIGSLVNAASYGQLSVGWFNQPKGGESSNSWVTTDPLFVVGNGTGDLSRSNAMMILKNGNIGLGSNSPNHKLHVEGAVKIASTLDMSGARILSVGNPTDSSDAANKFYVDAVASSISSSSDFVKKSGDTMSGDLQILAASRDVSFKVSGWDAPGNGYSPGLVIEQFDQGQGFGSPKMTLSYSRGTPSAPLGNTETNQEIGVIQFGSKYSGVETVLASIVAQTAGISDFDGGSNKDTILHFRTIDGTTLSNRMTILGSGNVGIGTAAPTAKLHVLNSNEAVRVSPSTGTHAVYQTFGNTGGDALIGVANSIGSSPAASGGLGYAMQVISASGRALQLSATGHMGQMTLLPTGEVGIGTNAPAVALDVQGQIRSRVYNAGSSKSIDWNNGNMQYTSATCANDFTFSNMLEGGSYTLIVTSGTSGQCEFAQSSPDSLPISSSNPNVWKFLPANAATTATKTTIFSFVRAGGVVYVSWMTGF